MSPARARNEGLLICSLQNEPPSTEYDSLTTALPDCCVRLTPHLLVSLVRTASRTSPLQGHDATILHAHVRRVSVQGVCGGLWSLWWL